MVQFRNQEKEIIFKIVYYGPALGGKTTNLETLHKITDPEGKNKLTSLKTSEDRTLFFDLLPFDLGEIQGYKIRIQVYTVPGQVHYNTTRRIVLSGADAIIFVADSQISRLSENKVSWENMKANLLTNKMNLETLPLVIQCNKIDLENIASKEEIIEKIGIKKNDYEVVLSSAIRGDGVIETFRKVVSKSLIEFAKRFKLFQKGVTSQKLEESVREFFDPFENKRFEVEKEVSKKVEEKIPLKGLSEEEQLVAALKSTTELAEKFGEVERAKNLYEDKLKEMTFLHHFGKELDNMKQGKDIALYTINSLSKIKPNYSYTLYRWEGKNLERTINIGFEEDPFWKDKSLLLGFLVSIIGKKETLLIDDIPRRVQELTGSLLPLPQTVFVFYLFDFYEAYYTIFIYEKSGGKIHKDFQTFLNILGELVNAKVSNLKMIKEVEKLNSELEKKVLERTAALSKALEDLKEVDNVKRAFLNSVSHEIKTPLTTIKSHCDFLIRHPEMWFDKGNEYLNKIILSVKKLEELIETMLSFSYIKEPFRGEKTDLMAVLDSTLSSLSAKIREKNIEIKVEAEKGQVFFPINKKDAEILMVQLIDNAIKFSPKNEKIKIFVIDESKRVIFSVRDYGEGFSKESRNLLFEPPIQGCPGTLSFKSEGLGMGLFFVREILGKYGGTVSIDDMNPGTNVLVEFSKKIK